MKKVILSLFKALGFKPCTLSFRERRELVRYQWARYGMGNNRPVYYSNDISLCLGDKVNKLLTLKTA